MRGEEIVVAAELTGKLNHVCFYCRSKHIRKGGIERCASKFVGDMFGTQRMQTRHKMPTLNPLDMAKRGQLARYAELNGLSMRLRLYEYWHPNWQEFVRCETIAEAYDMARDSLEAWRKANMPRYTDAMDAFHTIQSQYGDLLVKDPDKVMKNPEKLTYTKKMDSTGREMAFELATADGTLTIPGNTVLWFYAEYWGPIHPHGFVVDADLNKDVLVTASANRTSLHTGKPEYAKHEFKHGKIKTADGLTEQPKL